MEGLSCPSFRTTRTHTKWKISESVAGPGGVSRPVATGQANQAIAWGPELAGGPQTTTGYELNATTNCVRVLLNAVLVNAGKCSDTVIGIPLKGAPHTVPMFPGSYVSSS